MHVDVAVDDDDAVRHSLEFLLKTAVVNIIDNACKYSPDHTANVVLKRENDLVSILVEDNGIGISKENQKRIFEKFYRVPGTKPGGTGLVLDYLWQRIMAARNLGLAFHGTELERPALDAELIG